jgi:hypothetical protein
LSNLIGFKTLKRPLVKVIMIDADRVELEVFLACRLEVNDYDLNNPQIYVENSCDNVKLFLTNTTSQVI